jgi:hypothetical protein
MRITSRPMSKKERLFNTLAGIALVVVFASYGLHFLASGDLEKALRFTWSRS